MLATTDEVDDLENVAGAEHHLRVRCAGHDLSIALDCDGARESQSFDQPLHGRAGRHLARFAVDFDRNGLHDARTLPAAELLRNLGIAARLDTPHARPLHAGTVTAHAPRTLSLPRRATLTGAVRPTRAEIDLAAVRHNVRVVREMVGTEVWAVVKADAYGHGAVPVAQAMASAGAAGLCVALVEEGLELREAGITLPILVMSGVYREGLDEALAAGLTPVIYDPSQLEPLSVLARPAHVHLKIDTGMARLGITTPDLPRVAARLAAMRHVRVEGLMTHFASADLDDPGFTHVQLERFAAARRVVLEAGLSPRVMHASNSAGAFRFPEARFDLVRTGIVLYGVAPFPHAGPALLPAFRVRTEVIALRQVSRGAPVGYSGAYVTGRETVVATVPVGYADGFFRRLSSEAEVLVRGARARVIGNVSMDMATVDVTHIARSVGVSVGDEVVLLGPQSGPAGADIIRAEEIAARVGTIPYEVLCAVSRRVPRGYLHEEPAGSEP